MRIPTSLLAAVCVALLAGPALLAVAGDDDGAKKEKDAAPKEELYAVTLKVKGEVEVIAAAGKRRLAPRDLLAVGDLLRPAEGAKAWLLRRDGRYEDASRPLELGVGIDLREEPSPVFVACVAEVERLAREARTDVVAAGGATRSALAPRPVAPRARLLTDRPAFRWRERRPGSRYRLIVEPVAKAGEEAAAPIEVDVESEAWSWPADRGPLAPGLYRWRLEVVPGEGEKDAFEPADLRSARAVFMVLDEEQRREIRERLAAFEKSLPADDAGLRHLLLACFYRQDGVYLLEEARAELERAVEAKVDAEIVEPMRESIERALGL